MNTPDTEATHAPKPADNTQQVTLDYPLKTATGQEIRVITIHKPSSGALRNLALTDILRMDTNAIRTILPRVAQPTLVKQDLDNIDPADLVQLGTAVVSFLVPKAEKPDFLGA